MPGRATQAQGGPAHPLDRAVERFDVFSASLVRLEPHPFEEVRRTVEGFAALVERHLQGAPRRPPGAVHGTPGWSEREERLYREHERFLVSIEQLRGILLVVEADDHGGHRQALGQYGRIFAEAMRMHRREERAQGRRRPSRRPPHPHAAP